MVFAQALVWANKRSKSRKIASLSNHTWIIVDDPIATGVITTKNIPNVGAIMGYWIFITDLRGIHKVPAGRLQTLTGIRGLVGEITDKTSLRDLANA
jgi:hypothetical protein